MVCGRDSHLPYKESDTITEHPTEKSSLVKRWHAKVIGTTMEREYRNHVGPNNGHFPCLPGGFVTVILIYSWCKTQNVVETNYFKI